MQVAGDPEVLQRILLDLPDALPGDPEEDADVPQGQARGAVHDVQGARVG